MWDRLLLAVDQSEAGQAALSLAVGLTEPGRSSVVVLHVRERPSSLRVPPLESMDEASALADEAVATLNRHGTTAWAVVRSAGQHRVADVIASEARAWSCDAIVLGSTRLRGLHRLNGSGIRERLVRRSALPVLLAPAALHLRTRLPTGPARGHHFLDHH